MICKLKLSDHISKAQMSNLGFKKIHILGQPYCHRTDVRKSSYPFDKDEDFAVGKLVEYHFHHLSWPVLADGKLTTIAMDDLEAEIHEGIYVTDHFG